MATFRKLPLEVEAVQFTGNNWAEMHAFTGHRRIEGQVDPNTQATAMVDVFTEMGTYLLDYVDEHVNCPAELWVEANKSVLPIGIGEWVIKDQYGFYPCKDDVFQQSYVDQPEYEALSGFKPDAVPEVDEGSTDARIIGRVRMSMVLTRPMTEVDFISNKLVDWCTAYRVLADSQLVHTEETMGKVYSVLVDYFERVIDRDGRDNAKAATEVVSALQNKGILFRERR